MSVDPDAVQSVIERWFPDAVITVTRAGGGVSTPVFRVIIHGEIAWARLGEERGERRDGEVAAHRVLSGRGLPVPAVLRYAPAPPGVYRSLCLTTHIPGVPLSTCRPGAWHGAVAAGAGRVLAQINRIPVRGFGWAFASAGPDGPIGEHRTRPEWVGEYRDAFQVVQNGAGFTPSTVTRIGGAIEQWCAFTDTAAAYLAHGDFDASHVYVDEERQVLTGVIDFGEMRGADRLYDLGHLLLHDGEEGRPPLLPDVLAGYRDVVPLPDDVLEHIRIQAVAIGTRALAIQLPRGPSRYREWLTRRLDELA